jgi:tetratricopeptide (TPR) repeat protein
MKKALRSSVIIFQILLVSSGICLAQDQAVLHYVMEEEILEHNQLPLDPYPPFGLLTGYVTYPFQFYGSKYFSKDTRAIKILVAENEYLKIGMAPDYGGRLWFVYDKIRQKEVIHRNYKEAMFYNSGMGYQYLGGGLELNIPNAHSQTNARKRDCVIKENRDGSVSLVMSNTEKIGRLHWSVAFTLSPGEARIKQEVRLANESPLEERYLYWANCGVPVNGNTEFIYPENRGALHGKYENAVSWPTYANTDISILKNVDEAVGFYMLGAREGYMGYYNHDENFGLVHYADVNDLPGKKYWSWGWHVTAQNKKYTHAEGVNYGEIQSGRIVIQEKFNKILPGASIEWSHYWYPIGAIGSFNGASENAAINFRLEEQSDTTCLATIKIQANINYENPRVLIRGKAKIIKEIKPGPLRPEKPFITSVHIEPGNTDSDSISLELVDENNKLISGVLAAAQKPKKYDSYFIPEKKSAPKAEDFTAEGLFAQAEVLLNDWFYHLPEIKEILNRALTVDPAFSRAHAELGLLDLRGGRFESALEHFDKALKRVPDNGRALYYKGLALRYLGQYDEAVYFLRHSGRFGFEFAERIAEAEIAVNRDDFAEANQQLAKALRLNSTLVSVFVLKAMVEKKLDNTTEALALLARAKEIDSESSFSQCAEYILNGKPPALGESIVERYINLPEELFEVVASFYRSGLQEEALQVIALIEQTNPIIDLYRTELAYLTQSEPSGADFPKTEVNDFAWRLEEYRILKRRAAAEPGNGHYRHLLGDFFYAHDYEAEGISHWEKAAALGHENKIMLVSLYRAYKKLGDKDKAYKCIVDAYAMDEDDPYILEYYISEVSSRQGRDVAVALMEDNYEKFDKSYSLKATLMNSYLYNKEYAKLEDLLLRSDLYDTHRLSFGDYWKNLKMAKGYNKLREKEYQEALSDFEAATNVPRNIAQRYMASFSDQARRLFYMGYCNAKMGNHEKAETLWEEALNLKRDSRFQASYRYEAIKTLYYQAFCLRGLGRNTAADNTIQIVQEYANSTTVSGKESLQKLLLKLSVLGRCAIDDFVKWDPELGLIRTNVNFNAPEE